MEGIEKVKMNVMGKFWTRQNEMVEELESLDYWVVYRGWEEVIVVDLQDEDEPEFDLCIGHANGTMWVEDVK